MNSRYNANWANLIRHLVRIGGWTLGFLSGYYGQARDDDSWVLAYRKTNLGDSQTAVYIRRENWALSTTAWQTVGAVNVPSGAVYAFHILLAGTNAGNSRSFGFEITGVIENAGGTTSILGTPTVNTLYNGDDTSITAQAAADNTNDDLLVQVSDSDAAGGTILWVARIQTADVRWY